MSIFSREKKKLAAEATVFHSPSATRRFVREMSDEELITYEVVCRKLYYATSGEHMRLPNQMLILIGDEQERRAFVDQRITLAKASKK